jgi:hypothetical protein
MAGRLKIMENRYRYLLIDEDELTEGALAETPEELREVAEEDEDEEEEDEEEKDKETPDEILAI